MVEISEYPRTNYAPYLGAAVLDGGPISEFASTSGAVLASENDVLMLWDGERSGLVGRKRSGVVSSTVMKLSPKPVIDSDFLYYLLDLHFEWIQGRRTGTGVPHVPKDLWRILVLRYPSELNEQRRIAEILVTVDEAIGQTEALISKTQQIKIGLTHDLFTRGVTADGQLRPPREEAPKLYKESPLGLIPKEWQAEGLNRIGTWVSGGTPAKAQPRFWGGDVPWVTPKDMKVFRLGSTEDTLTPLGAASGSRIIPKDSVLIVVRGMILAHTFPVCLATAQMAFNQDVKALVPSALANGEFLAYWFAASKDYMLGLVTEATHGTKRIDMRDIFRSHVGVPPVREQVAIVGLLNEVDAKLGAAFEEAAKLRNIRLGLMTDLLTGRVPATARGSHEVVEAVANV